MKALAPIYLSEVYCTFLQEDLEVKKDEQFTEIMALLVQRYFRNREKMLEETEIQKLRKELLELSTILKDALSPA
jgi:hypothetical protein